MTKWEYKIISKSDFVRLGSSYDEEKNQIEKTLTSLGLEGWELVTVYNGVVFYLKRPCQ